MEGFRFGANVVGALVGFVTFAVFAGIFARKPAALTPEQVAARAEAKRVNDEEERAAKAKKDAEAALAEKNKDRSIMAAISAVASLRHRLRLPRAQIFPLAGARVVLSSWPIKPTSLGHT